MKITIEIRRARLSNLDIAVEVTLFVDISQTLEDLVARGRLMNRKGHAYQMFRTLGSGNNFLLFFIVS